MEKILLMVLLLISVVMYAADEEADVTYRVSYNPQQHTIIGSAIRQEGKYCYVTTFFKYLNDGHTEVSENRQRGSDYSNGQWSILSRPPSESRPVNPIISDRLKEKIAEYEDNLKRKLEQGLDSTEPIDQLNVSAELSRDRS